MSKLLAVSSSKFQELVYRSASTVFEIMKEHGLDSQDLGPEEVADIYSHFRGALIAAGIEPKTK